MIFCDKKLSKPINRLESSMFLSAYVAMVMFSLARVIFVALRRNDFISRPENHKSCLYSTVRFSTIFISRSLSKATLDLIDEDNDEYDLDSGKSTMRPMILMCVCGCNAEGEVLVFEWLDACKWVIAVDI